MTRLCLSKAKLQRITIVYLFEVDGALEAGKKIPLLDIGAGVYPTTLFFNHSCAPNTLRINQGTRVSKVIGCIEKNFKQISAETESKKIDLRILVSEILT